ncbi:MAG: undecaprenyl-diphosphate phosphatase [Halanaerobiaceae bacterium]
MEIIKAVILGTIQGLTEFLPVSSSGHLVISQTLLGLDPGQLTLNVFLHFGTLLPIFIIFWQDIRDIILLKKEKRTLTLLIIIGTLPAGLLGVTLKNYISLLYASTMTTGYMLLITGSLLFLAEKIPAEEKDLTSFRPLNALLVGFFQALAILPGISRSGSTIVGALLQKLNREDAARFSFLLSIPVILGAGVLEAGEILVHGTKGTSYSAILSGTLMAAISGYLAIKFLLHILKKGSLIVFSIYCWSLGAIVLLSAGLF